jgi:hypothetical protein
LHSSITRTRTRTTPKPKKWSVYYFSKFNQREACIIIQHFASNKLNLLSKILNQNNQTLQLFTKIIQKESIYKSN